MSCCGGNCGCGANCKCGSGCKGCKMFPDITFGEKTVESTMLQATASDLGGICEARSVAGESGQGSSGGSGCRCNPCNCNPCNCK